MPVDYTAYPTGTELLARLQSTGIVKDPPTGSSALIDWDAKMEAVVREWNKLTGYDPFLIPSDATETTVTHYSRQIRRGILKLSNGFSTLSSLTIDDTEQALDTDYNTVSGSGPITKIRFLSDVSGTIAATGIVGYSTTLPADVHEVLLERGMYKCVPELALNISGGRTDIKAGDVGLSFVRSSGNRASSGGPLSGESDFWNKNWIAKVQQFRR